MTRTDAEIQADGVDRADWSTRASVFFDHWCTLRQGNNSPKSELFLDSPNPRIQSNVFIFEVADDSKTVFRLVATDIVTIWGRDFTGLSVEQAFTEDIARLYLLSPKTCLSQPCGLWERGLFGDARGREVTLELMYLPLSTAESRPPRLGGFLNWLGTSNTAASRLGLIELLTRRWIDTGFGTPASAPNVFKV